AFRRASSSPQGRTSGCSRGFHRRWLHAGAPRHAGPDEGGGGGAQKLPVPQLGRQNRDERLILTESLRAPGPAAPNQSSDGLWIEDSRAPQAHGIEQRLHVLRRPPVEERRHVRRPIWLFAPAGDGRRQEAGGLPPASQDVLLPQTPQLAARRKRGREFDEPVVEVGNARF